MRFTLREHLFIALQGIFLFTIGYWLVYLAESHITSGLVAVVLSSIIFMNIANSALFLKTRIQLHVLLGALIGIAGILLIFWPELKSFKLSDSTFRSLILAVLSGFIFSLGNIISAQNQKHNLPVVQTNTYSMGYGALILLGLILISSKPLRFVVSVPYIGSLFYLSILGSVVAFWSYLSLIGRIGPGKAGYTGLVTPVLALLLSTLFEGYQWLPISYIGVVLICTGNIIVLNRRGFNIFLRQKH
jgi:drug/metabolite transporter (DMT)-like permease